MKKRVDLLKCLAAAFAVGGLANAGATPAI